jgi:hypothetical protein
VEALAAYVGRSQASAAHHRLAREVLQGGNTRSVLHTAPFPRQLSVGLASREVRRGDDLVTLTPTEYGILAVLVRHLCQVLSHEQILQAVWGEHYGESQYLWVHIGHLRRKLEPNSKRPCYILIERGVWLSPGEAGGGVSAYDLPVIVGGVAAVLALMPVVPPVSVCSPHWACGSRCASGCSSPLSGPGSTCGAAIRHRGQGASSCTRGRS